MTDRARIFLVAPSHPDPAVFPEHLAEALAAADVAAVLLGFGALGGGAAELVGRIQAAGAAALIADDTRLVGRLKADGVHVSTGPSDLRLAAESFRPQRIVGVGDIHTRDAAMELGEIGADYLLFGEPHGDTQAEPHPRALDLASWWSEVMQIPCVLMAGRAIAGVEMAATSGAEFIGLHDFVWSHAGGPGQALREAAEVLGQPERRAA